MSEYRMAAIFRADLPLPPGKMAAQAGHAFVDAWHASCMGDIEASHAKMVLVAPDEAALRAVMAKATERGVSSALITDAARTVLKKPTVTVLGLGPMCRSDYNAITRGLKLAP